MSMVNRKPLTLDHKDKQLSDRPASIERRMLVSSWWISFGLQRFPQLPEVVFSAFDHGALILSSVGCWEV
jgi:hypothetical protein